MGEPTINEPLVERITDALAGYHDFGEGQADAEWQVSWDIAAHIGKRLPNARIVEDWPSVQDAIRVIIDGGSTSVSARDYADAVDRLAVLIGDE